MQHTSQPQLEELEETNLEMQRNFYFRNTTRYEISQTGANIRDFLTYKTNSLLDV